MTSATVGSPRRPGSGACPVATIVREAIDRGLANPDARRQAAAQRVLDAPDMAVPEPAELRAELDALRARHA